MKHFLKNKWVAFALMVSFALSLAACASDDASSDATTASTTQETTTESVATESTEESADGKIRVSEHYYYLLPEGFRVVDADFGDVFSNQREFVSEDGQDWIHSFADEQENYPFPDIIDAVFEGKNADIEYQDFIFDEPIYRVKHLERDESGNTMHVTSFAWMDGTEELCWIDIASLNENQAELEEQIFDTIGVYGSVYDYVDIPGQDASAYEEHDLDEIKMREAQQAMRKEYERDMQKQMEDMFGRKPL